ncbi:MAG: HEAT repeat protein [Pseudoalteromonas tetraodonis]|jgi:HEAT repeat protein
MKTRLSLVLVTFVAVVSFNSICSAVEPSNWRKVRMAALKDARSELASEREVAFESFLGEQDHREAAELLVKSITSPSVALPVKRHARDVLATFRADECREYLYRLLRSDPDKNHLLLEAFAGMEDERGVEIGGLAIKAGGSARRGGVPIMAAGIRCLVSSGEVSDAAIGSIIERTGDGQAIAVRKAAADAMIKIRTPKAIEALVGLVDDAAIGKRARLLMVQIAGEDAGSDKSDWEAWWAAKNATPPEAEPLSAERAEQLVAERAAAAVDSGEEASITFYGVPIVGKNIVFVMDASSSMRGYPLERLKTECISLVGQLPETHKFALVFYPKNESYPSELHLADDETKKKAYEFINKRQVIRGTPTGDAMEFAFRRYVVGQDVDSIYLLSDGRPTKPIPDVIDTIDNLNIGLYVTINTIYIGAVAVPDPNAPAPDPNAAPVGPIKTGADFLKEVARRHSGTFSIVEVVK